MNIPSDFVGRLERSFEFFTNDPRSPIIKLTVSARVKPLPNFVKRIQNASIAYGSPVGDLLVWPSASPSLVLDRGEVLAISLRIRPRGPGELAAMPFSAGLAIPTDIKPKPIQLESASDGLTCKLRSEGDLYWLDVQIGPFSEPGLYLKRVLLKADSEPFNISFSIRVPAESIIVEPKSLDLGSISLSDLKGGLKRPRANLAVRKLVGALQVKMVSADLAFLKLELVPIVEGSSYLIRVIVNPAEVTQARSFEGSIQIQTDDPNRPLIEVPCKVAFLP
jgi:hypothetical protein